MPDLPRDRGTRVSRSPHFLTAGSFFSRIFHLHTSEEHGGKCVQWVSTFICTFPKMSSTKSSILFGHLTKSHQYFLHVAQLSENLWAHFPMYLVLHIGIFSIFHSKQHVSVYLKRQLKNLKNIFDHALGKYTNFSHTRIATVPLHRGRK
jgi:hypothetical protein